MEKLRITLKKDFKNIERDIWKELSLVIFCLKKKLIFNKVFNSY